MYADELVEARRGEGSAAGVIHATDDLKMDMHQFVEYFSSSHSQPTAQSPSAAAGNVSSTEARLRSLRPPKAPSSSHALRAPAPSPAAAVDTLGASGEVEKAAAARRKAALPYLFMRIDCDSDGFVTCA